MAIDLKTLSKREKIMVIMVAVVIIGGGYGLLRIKPVLKAIADTKAAIVKGEDRLIKTVVEEEPSESPAQLERDQLAAETQLQLRKQEVAEMETRLAPKDSQELRLRISELAADNSLRIRINQPYGLTKAIPGTTAAASFPQTRRGVRAAAREARRANAAAQAQTTAAQTGANPLAPVSGMHGLMDEMAKGAQIERPLQELGLEGTFDDMQQFLEGLQSLPWQVTVVQMQMSAVVAKDNFRGPQQVSSTLIMQY